MNKYIVFSPFSVDNNFYVNNIKEIIKNNLNLEPVSFKKFFTNPKIFFNTKYVNLNWFENCSSFSLFIKKVFVIYLLLIFGKRITFTIHNKKPHNSKSQKYSSKLFKLLCRKSYKLIGLCDDTKKVISDINPLYCKKLYIIPHPSYLKNYSNLFSNKNKESDLVFLFLGNVSKYKQVDCLIDCFSKFKDISNVKLIIAGKPESKEYGDYIKDLSKNLLNIELKLGFVSDEEIPKLFSKSDICILPYDIDESLNSGAVFLSFSLSTTILSSRIGSVNNEKIEKFAYIYSYNNSFNHGTELTKEITKVINDFLLNKSLIKEKGKMALKYIREFHSDSIIAEKYKEIYNY